MMVWYDAECPEPQQVPNNPLTVVVTETIEQKMD
jgi:hypothetical protein